MSDVLTITQKAFDESERIFSKAMGLAVDPEIMQYRDMNDSDFEAIRNRYGLDAVGRYITHMEARIAKAIQDGD